MKLIVLDRDGVINFDSDRFIKTPEEWRAIPGSLEAIALLNQRGYRVVVATNQSGIGRGLLDMAAFNYVARRYRHLTGPRVHTIFKANEKITPRRANGAARERGTSYTGRRRLRRGGRSRSLP